MSEQKKAPPGWVEVTFARPYTADGKDHKQDDTAFVSPDEADTILRFGYGRPSDPKLAQIHGFPVPTSKKEG